MKIVVCVKQVPEVTNVQVDPKTGTLIREGVKSILNPFCEYALDHAVPPLNQMIQFILEEIFYIFPEHFFDLRIFLFFIQSFKCSR